MLIYEIVDAFEKRGLKYAIVGGYALAMHGVVRATDYISDLARADENENGRWPASRLGGCSKH